MWSTKCCGHNEFLRANGNRGPMIFNSVKINRLMIFNSVKRNHLMRIKKLKILKQFCFNKQKASFEHFLCEVTLGINTSR
jgi:hypothetical protein